jgi:hypothetical protein
LVGLADELSKTIPKEMTSVVINLRGKLTTAQAQAESVFNKALELLGKTPPLRGSMKDTGAYHVPQQMKETTLFKERCDFVIGPEEITDQDAFKKFSQDLFEDRGGSGRRDEVISDLLVGETPEPIGFPQDPPSCFIDMEQGAGSGQHPEGFVPG